MKKTKTIAYTFLIGDLFHFGHLRMLLQAKNSADLHICGVIGDKAAKRWQTPVVALYRERKAVIENLCCVDEVMLQESRDPSSNIEILHKRFPHAKIILFQSHNKWAQMPGVEFVLKIGGEVVKPDFYPRLSRTSISTAFINEFISQGNRLESLQTGDVQLGYIETYHKRLSTKANTLKTLKPLLKKASIEKLFVFTVFQWKQSRNPIVRKIQKDFKGKTIIIRSSALHEDTFNRSSAGLFDSALNVDSSDPEQIFNTVNTVVDGYTKRNSFSNKNQVLVQIQTKNVKVSGVLFTRNLETNTPYYFINYDDTSSDTDTVTGGLINKKLEILHNTSLSSLPLVWRKLITAVREIERLLSGVVLDIEFAITEKNQVVVFQVRPLAANANFITFSDNQIFDVAKKNRRFYNSLVDKNDVYLPSTYLSDMAFWNPAELVGNRPHSLDYSLFNYLFMKSTWNRGLRSLGYTSVSHNLIELIAGKPYVNVNHAFLCLLPQRISLSLKKKLLHFYCDKLKKNPELHDKIEFQIVHNCFDFSFDSKSHELSSHGFLKGEVDIVKSELLLLTNTILRNYRKIIQKDLALIEKLRTRRTAILKEIQNCKDWRYVLRSSFRFLEDCRELGALPFTRIARLAFIGKRLIESLKECNILSEKEYSAYFSTIETVANEMDIDYIRVSNGSMNQKDFLNRYGHLRSGTYDITQYPYRTSKDYLKTLSSKQGKQYSSKTAPGFSSLELKQVEKRITMECVKSGIHANGKKILDFVRRSIQLREELKFEFTKNLCEAIECIASAGKMIGFNREDLSYLDIHTLSICCDDKECSPHETANIWSNVIRGRKDEEKTNSLVSLPSLVFGEHDFQVVCSYKCRPNFITNLLVRGETVTLDDNRGSVKGNRLKNKIVVVEKADPGYDWIFSMGIVGLITKYGGAASHMAIRCAEFNIPAIIGCGDILYQEITKSNRIIMDCKNNKLQIL